MDDSPLLEIFAAIAPYVPGAIFVVAGLLMLGETFWGAVIALALGALFIGLGTLMRGVDAT